MFQVDLPNRMVCNSLLLSLWQNQTRPTDLLIVMHLPYNGVFYFSPESKDPRSQKQKNLTIMLPSSLKLSARRKRLEENLSPLPQLLLAQNRLLRRDCLAKMMKMWVSIHCLLSRIKCYRCWRKSGLLCHPNCKVQTVPSYCGKKTSTITLHLLCCYHVTNTDWCLLCAVNNTDIFSVKWAGKVGHEDAN